jgi:PAS domain S-box-containing protein
MNLPHDSNQDDLLRQIIGLGETSVRKNYYPELQRRLQDLERFHALLNNSDDPIFTVEVQSGLIRNATKSLSTLSGYPMAELFQMTIYDLLLPLDEEKTRQVIASIKDHPGQKERFTVNASSASGQKIPLEIAITHLMFSGEDYAVIVAREISERLRAQQAIERQLNRLSALHQIDLEITNYNEIIYTLDTVIQLAQANMGIDGAIISRFDPQTKSYRTVSWFHVRDPKPLINYLDVSKINQDQWIQLVGVETIRKNSHRLDLGDLGRFKSYVGVPLILKGETIGFFEIFYLNSVEISPDELTFLISLATQAAIAINSSDLVNGLRTTNSQLQMAYDATLEGWALALELREKETAMHTRRVVEMTGLMAAELGVSGEMLVNFRRGALLHDIGKMGIPDAILLKPGPLDEDEWEIMRQHPTYAYKMLEPISFLRLALDIPYAHHERWDGKGYPRGLSRREIPLAARIFTIVDVWDALLSDRPYRAGWAPEKVYQYLRDEAGSRFDPELIEIFFKVIANQSLRSGS